MATSGSRELAGVKRELRICDTSTTLHAFFCARRHPGASPLPYEYRPGQLEMAKAVERALEERRHLIVEAGTGTGKTLAYLLPALRTGRG
jgi:ATP-dependent DNA helicase DinG